MNLSFSGTKHVGPRVPLSLACVLLCSVLMAVGFAVRVARAVSKQAPIEVLHVPELEAGFHFLYELKVEEAHTQFATWQKLHPTGPLGSASQAAGYLFEECYRQALSNSEHPIKVRGITRESDGCHR